MEKHKYIVIDTETAGTLEEPLVYDCGFAVVDNTGRIYEQHSYVIMEVFFGMKDLMQTAYYAEKIPQYLNDIDMGKRQVARFFYVQGIIKQLCIKYHIQAIIAHNMRFDRNALNYTTSIISGGLKKYFLPYNVDIWCTLAMSKSLLSQRPVYRQWCEKNDFLTKYHQPRFTAEILFRFITGNMDFTESHTGLEDVLIESQIFAYCVRQHKPMQRHYWKD